MTMHPQVGFETIGGQIVEVDEDMFPILVELHRLGVRTQYSCQGDASGHGSYVLADWFSFYPILWKMRMGLLKNSYSKDARRAAQKLLAGFREVAVVWFYIRRRDEAKFLFQRGFKTNQRWSIETQLDNRYGLRLTLRWPAKELDNIRLMLEETL